MALPGWTVSPATDKPCETYRESWSCPNMKATDGDTDMDNEHYSCSVCGRCESIDYDEIR